jgi:hypothetical protein
MVSAVPIVPAPFAVAGRDAGRCDSRAAIQREKAIKEWKRTWKLNLIEKTNPEWVDLSGLDPR